MSDDIVGTSGSTYSPAIAKASAYQKWIFDALAPAVGSSLLEVGVGSAPFLEWYQSLKFWYPADIDQNAIAHAVELCRRLHPDVETTGIAGDAGDPQFWTKAPEGVDSIIAVNVLEHIRDEAAFLRGAYETLHPMKGKIGLFVPALSGLYGTMDAAAGHYRRYTKCGLYKILTDANFKVTSIYYMNFAGVLYWWWNGKVKKITRLDDPGLNKSISRMDQIAVPIIRALEGAIHPPIGQSLVAIAES
jgi:hypothetical protein